MPRQQELRIGHIPYLNCVPFFHYLRDTGFNGQILAGVPSALNRMLRQGEVDLSPSSSFEYALNWRDYLLLPGFSISSCGSVKSVLLFSPSPLENLQGVRIAITGDSATSINLLRVLLHEYYGFSQVEDYVPAQQVEELIACGKPALLIGDRAMRQAAALPVGMAIYDLGELWFRHTGLPFVFALWILRRNSSRKKSRAVEELQQQLRNALELALTDLATLALKSGACDDEVDGVVDYWRTIDYVLTDRHLAGLQMFVALCHKYGLLSEIPEIEFFSTVSRTLKN